MTLSSLSVSSWISPSPFPFTPNAGIVVNVKARRQQLVWKLSLEKWHSVSSSWFRDDLRSGNRNLSVSRNLFSSKEKRKVFSVLKAQKNDVWKEVIDTSSGKPYFWNTVTNETSWTLPSSPDTGILEQNLNLVSSETTRNAKVSHEELLTALLSADLDRFGGVVDLYRPQCFEDEFTDFLNLKVDEANDSVEREKFEKLRARLANPLLKNPTPY